MSSDSSLPPVAPLQTGAVVGGRFKVERQLETGTLGTVYLVNDERSGKSTALRLISGAVARDAEDVERIREGVKAAAGLTHRNIVGIYGMGIEPSGDLFVTMENVDGVNLQTLLERRAASAKHFSLRGAFNVLAHVCNALEYAHGKSVIHGSLSPHHILVTRAGRVKVAGFALSRILPTFRSLSSSLRMYLMPYLAPEVRERSRRMDARADVYSVAVVMFELLGGKPRAGITPAAEALPPSVPASVRSILSVGLDVDASRRPASPAAFREAIESALVGIGEIEKGDDDLSLDVEVDAAPAGAAERPAVSSGPPAPPRAGARPSPSPPARAVAPSAAAPGAAPSTPARPAGSAGALLRAAVASSPPSEAPRRGSRVSADAGFRPDIAPSTGSIVALPVPTGVDFGAILNELDADDVERWMLQKDKLDHGPFRDRELAEMILRGAALADHAVTNLETGKRAKLKQLEEFKPFLERYRIRKKQEEEQEALRRSVRVERLGFAAKAGIALGILAGITGAALALYYGLRGDESAAATVREDNTVAMAGPSRVSGIQDIKASEPEKLPPSKEVAKQKGKRRSGSSGSRSGSSGSHGRGAGMEDWDTAYNKGGDLDLGSDDTAPILTAREITAKIRTRQGALFSCLRGEMSRNPGLSGDVTIQMLVRGHQIVAVQTPGASPAMERCVGDALSAVRFDSQAYGQMRSSFTMGAGR